MARTNPLRVTNKRDPLAWRSPVFLFMAAVVLTVLPAAWPRLLLPFFFAAPAPRQQ